MTALWTSQAIAEATGARITRDFKVMGISIDSRDIAAGDLFVALTDQRDGHDFVAAALQAGAAGALVSRIPDGVSAGAPLAVVADVLPALEDLGHAARVRTGAKVIAVTGSVGKTSTKEMLRTALAGQGRVHAAEKSFNNHWGVPLTLARMPAATNYAIIEIGMNQPGEIAPLSRLARPHVGIVTNVGAVHMAAFEDLSGIAREKAEIVAGLEPGGTAVLNADGDTFPILSERASLAGATIIRFGKSRAAQWRLDGVAQTGAVTVVRATGFDQPVLFKLSAAGRHFALNALAVLAAVQAAGGDIALAAIDLAGWQAPAGRGERHEVHLDAMIEGASVDLIDDAYNANPVSLGAALDVLAAATPRDGVGRVGKGRRVAILGDMLELGADEAALHAAIARHPAMADIAIVHTAGPLMAHLHEALSEEKRGQHAADAQSLAVRAARLIDAGDVVLVKGSKGSRIALVVDAIRNLGHSRG